MPGETFLTAALARAAGLPLAFARRGTFHAPHKALILQPCCLSQVMLATPLAAALAATFPETRFDWAVSDWARMAVAGNPHITELLLLGEEIPQQQSWRQIGQLVVRLYNEHYDTVFIPSGSTLLSYIAWQARIPQRVGLNVDGRGFAHTVAVKPPAETRNAGERALLLATAVGAIAEVTEGVSMGFYPSDRARMAVTRRLVEEVDWLGDAPLVIMHPGGGENPVRSRPLIRWPVGRFVLLANHLSRQYGARILLVGSAGEQALAAEIAGLSASKLVNYCGQLSLGELGALCEVSDLYIGHDTGPTHIAAASGCQTLVIFGPTDPALSRPYAPRGNVRVLWRDLGLLEDRRPFTWDVGVTVEEAIKAVDTVLSERPSRARALTYLTGKQQ